LEFYLIMAYITEWLGAVGLSWFISHSPRFKRPPLGFVHAKRDGVVALSLYAIILIFAIIFSFANPPIFPEPLRLTPAPVQDLGQAVLLAVLCLVPFLAALFYRRQPFKSIGWNPQILVPGLQMGIALAFLTIFLRNRVWDVLSGVGSPVLNLLVFGLVIAVAEETIFRGYIQLRLAWWLGKWPGLALTALLFTLWHLPVFLHGLALENILILSGLTFVQGLVLGWVMDKSGHVFAPAFYRALSIWVFFLG
jgi:membrane protease YdiL (CAAX protease family)